MALLGRLSKKEVYFYWNDHVPKIVKKIFSAIFVAHGPPKVHEMKLVFFFCIYLHFFATCFLRVCAPRPPSQVCQDNGGPQSQVYQYLGAVLAGRLPRSGFHP